MTQNVRRHPVNLGIPLATPLVMEPARIADSGQDQAVADALGSLSISRKPGDGPDCAGKEQESVRIPKIGPRKELGERGCDRQSGKIVIGKRRMAGMAENENLVAGPARKKAFTIRQVPIFKT